MSALILDELQLIEAGYARLTLVHRRIALHGTWLEPTLTPPELVTQLRTVDKAAVHEIRLRIQREVQRGR